MRIRSLETFPVALPFREPYVTATGTLERREMVLIRIEDEDGNEGWGDAVPLSLRGGESLAVVREQLEAVAVALPGDISLDEWGKSLTPPALAAIDAALLDLEGRASGLPAWGVLVAHTRRESPGGSRPRRVSCNGTLGGGDPGAVAAMAVELAAAGFGTLKVKVGTGSDRERLRAVREAVGPEVKLRIDANRAWSVDQAAEEIAAIEAEAGLELAEQPCAELDELASLRGRVSVPIVADESIASGADARRAVGLGACDAATLKLAKVGGPRAALRIASLLPSYLSSALDSPLGIAAAVHTAQALPGDGFVAELAHGLATSALFADNVAADARLRGPAIEPGSAPGLGIEIDRDAVERLAIR